MELDQKVLLLPVGKCDGLSAASGAPDDRNNEWKDHGLYNGYTLVMYGRSGLCLGDMARKKLVCHCGDGRYCGWLVGTSKATLRRQ
jgi:hypothetical protein